MRRKGFALDLLQIEYENIKPPRRRDLRILLPERSRSGIARILEQFLTGGFLLRREPLKRCARHIDLAADFKQLRRAFELQRNAADRLEIRGHILTDETVTACRSERKYAVFVFQRNR